MFNIKNLTDELNKYSNIIECTEQDGFLNIAYKNQTGKVITYDRIKNEMILPWFDLEKEYTCSAPRPVCCKLRYNRKSTG
tara:strand:- start:2175 stop:2414 length:240 start_codon:yes stop_codon:yes gene_type:complete